LPRKGPTPRLYGIWINMKSRCYNPNVKAYARYGGRGITICGEWKNNYRAFDAWARANGYRDDLTIDRIDVNGDYEPSNCRWLTREEQNQNRRNNTVLTFDGERKCLTEWARVQGIGQSVLTNRLKRGWSVEKALTYPVDHRKGRRGKNE
jgi:hypothetical protein